MASTKTTTLYLVRHGATDANASRPYVLQGRSIDLPLNPIGRSQADCVRRLFAQTNVSAILSSPLQRALETARIIAEPHGLQVATREAFLEVDGGKWEGLDWGRIRQQFPAEFERFQRDPAGTPYLGGESYRQVSERVVPAIENLLEEFAGRTIILVAHNIVNRVCVAACLGLDLVKAREVEQTNGGVNVLCRRDGKTQLLTLNSVFHLENGQAL